MVVRMMFCNYCTYFLNTLVFRRSFSRFWVTLSLETSIYVWSVYWRRTLTTPSTSVGRYNLVSTSLRSAPKMWKRGTAFLLYSTVVSSLLYKLKLFYIISRKGSHRFIFTFYISEWFILLISFQTCEFLWVPHGLSSWGGFPKQVACWAVHLNILSASWPISKGWTTICL